MMRLGITSLPQGVLKQTINNSSRVNNVRVIQNILPSYVNRRSYNLDSFSGGSGGGSHTAGAWPRTMINTGYILPLSFLCYFL